MFETTNQWNIRRWRFVDLAKEFESLAGEGTNFTAEDSSPVSNQG
jgi:hypothetical protein